MVAFTQWGNVFNYKENMKKKKQTHDSSGYLTPHGLKVEVTTVAMITSILMATGLTVVCLLPGKYIVNLLIVLAVIGILGGLTSYCTQRRI
jgi:hypothetical protein